MLNASGVLRSLVTDRQTDKQTNKQSTVTLAAHAHRGLTSSNAKSPLILLHKAYGNDHRHNVLPDSRTKHYMCACEQVYLDLRRVVVLGVSRSNITEGSLLSRGDCSLNILARALSYSSSRSSNVFRDFRLENSLDDARRLSS